MLDHPIFLQSIALIRDKMRPNDLDPLQQQVLERMIHTSGDFGIQDLLRFSSGSCQQGLRALQQGSTIIVDTSMAKEAIQPMSKRTINASVLNVLDWAPDKAEIGFTRTGLGMESLWKKLELEKAGNVAPIVVIGSSPTALEILLNLVSQGLKSPSLIVGMPVGFIGVQQSKDRLCKSNIPYIILNGSRGGAAVAASAINALLRAASFE